jgi:hypothetical protein
VNLRRGWLKARSFGCINDSKPSHLVFRERILRFLLLLKEKEDISRLTGKKKVIISKIGELRISLNHPFL